MLHDPSVKCRRGGRPVRHVADARPGTWAASGWWGRAP